MPVNASQKELIVLIFRHLKENGFHSAAEELLKQSPQGSEMGTEALSSSLVDIYSSWLKQSKNKHPTSNGRVSTPVQAASKEEKITAKKAQKPKSPKINKKDAKWSTSVKKEKQQNVAAAAATTTESDSDSSLDLEKWKEMRSQMTDVNVMKIDNIDALEFSSSSGKCVKKRVRKPPAKPETSTPLKQSAKERGGSGKETKSSSSKKNTPEKAKPETTLNCPPPTTQGSSSFREQQTMKGDKKRGKKETSRDKKPDDGIESGSWENKVLGQPAAQDNTTNGSKLNSQPKEEPWPIVKATDNVEEVKGKKKGKKTEKKATESPLKDQKGEKRGKRVSRDPDISDIAVKPKMKQKEKSHVNQNIFEPLVEEKEVQKIQTPLDPVQDDLQASTGGKPHSVDDGHHHHQTRTADISEKKAKAERRKSFPDEGAPPQGLEKAKKRKAHPEEVVVAAAMAAKKRKKDNLVKNENSSICLKEGANPNADGKRKKKKKLASTNTPPLFPPETPSPSPQKRKKKDDVPRGDDRPLHREQSPTRTQVSSPRVMSEILTLLQKKITDREQTELLCLKLQSVFDSLQSPATLLLQQLFN
ncbi:uncharacterized protein LOC144207332 isoform X2 [Stigmatopora nigra]